jgi:hypothetical protein
MKTNAGRYARLGIPEYFVFDRRQHILHGFRLPSPDARVYERIEARGGQLESRVLGMELTLAPDKVRFFVDDSPVLDAGELLARLGTALDDVERRTRALEQEIEEEERTLKEEQRKREEAERQLAEALAEIERLKRGG